MRRYAEAAWQALMGRIPGSRVVSTDAQDRKCTKPDVGTAGHAARDDEARSPQPATGSAPVSFSTMVVNYLSRPVHIAKPRESRPATMRR